MILQKDAPIMKPLDAPEKRPSVISAVELPNPAPIKAAVGPVHEMIRTVSPGQKCDRTQHLQ